MEELRVTAATFDVGGRPPAFPAGHHRYALARNANRTSTCPSRTAAIARRLHWMMCAGRRSSATARTVPGCLTMRTGWPQRALPVRRKLSRLRIRDFTVEPPRWPYAYARTVWLQEARPRWGGLARATLNAAALDKVIAGQRPQCHATRRGRRGRQTAALLRCSGPPPRQTVAGSGIHQRAQRAGGASRVTIRRLPRRPSSSPPSRRLRRRQAGGGRRHL